MPVAAVDKRGLKRICLSCSTRFYDFNKRPIVCPNCSIEFTGDVKIRTRRSRANDDAEGPISKIAVEEHEPELIKDMDDEAEETETVSLEELDEDEDDDTEEAEVIDADLELDADVEDEEDLDDDDEEDDDDDDDDDEDEDA